jgi:hypothetical protein
VAAAVVAPGALRSADRRPLQTLAPAGTASGTLTPPSVAPASPSVTPSAKPIALIGTWDFVSASSPAGSVGIAASLHATFEYTGYSATVHAGVNDTYYDLHKSDGTELNLGQGHQTLVAEEQPEQDFEAYLRTHLSGLLSWRVTGQTLTLTSADGSYAVLTRAQPATAAGVRPCAEHDLAMRFFGGSGGGGADIDGLELRNASTSDCVLVGPLEFSALDHAGRPMAETRSRQGLSIDAVLPPARELKDGERAPAGSYVEVEVAGVQSRSLCEQQQQVTPSILVLTIGGLRLTAANRDAESANGEVALRGCLLDARNASLS